MEIGSPDVRVLQRAQPAQFPPEALLQKDVRAAHSGGRDVRAPHEFQEAGNRHVHFTSKSIHCVAMRGLSLLVRSVMTICSTYSPIGKSAPSCSRPPAVMRCKSD